MSEDKAIRFACPHCQMAVIVNTKAAGHRFACPNPACGRPIVVPASEMSAAIVATCPLAVSPPEKPASSSRYEVFVSYSTNDKKWGDAICAALEAQQIRCWMAPRDIVPGTEWGAAIIGGIDSCKIMVLVFSAHANESPQVRREVERAINKGLRIVPLRVEDIKPAGAMEYALSNTHWLDAFPPVADGHMGLLAQAVKTLLMGGKFNGMSAPAADLAERRPLYQRIVIWATLATGFLIVVASCILLLAIPVGLLWKGSDPITKSKPDEVAKEVGNKAKSKDPAEPKELFFEDFRKGEGIPDGWIGDGFQIRKEDDTNWLEVSKAAGHASIKLPPLTLSGDFYIEGSCLIYSDIDFGKYPTFTITLEKTKGISPLALSISGNGNVWFGDEKHNASPTFKPRLRTDFRWIRTGKTVSVRLNQEKVAEKEMPQIIDYDILSVKMDAPSGSAGVGATYSRLYNLRIIALPPSKE